MIRNLLFDFGGVLLDLDVDKTFDSLSNLLNVNLEEYKSNEEYNQLLLDWECGKIHKEHFIWNLQHMAVGEKPQPLEVIKAWNAMLKGWQMDKFEVLEKLSKSYNLYLLSNTNQLHIESVERELKAIGKHDLFHRIFEKGLFYSHELGLRKPGKEIFEKIVDITGMTPEKTCFIEDSPKNFEHARVLGFNCLLHAQNAKIDYLLNPESFKF